MDEKDSINSFNLDAYKSKKLLKEEGKVGIKVPGEFRVRRPKQDIDFFWLNSNKVFPTVELYEDVSVRGERKYYLVKEELQGHFRGNLLREYFLYEGVTYQGERFLYPVKTPLPDSSPSETYYQENMRLVKQAQEMWVCITSDRLTNQRMIAEKKEPLPVFSDKSVQEIISEAFKGNTIDTEEHPIISKVDIVSKKKKT